MYLKRMELAGFKSFADRTELEFVPGVTAVVGPNGSGKSNISDSIRWVLGEQSAKNLRGAKMEDVIFAGSDSRRSVNFCEVSLTLDNSDGALPLDFAEVTITRRVYRSGDSEYLINRQVCRLKDIQELFMDTGLGKEAYSVIGQGRIEEILSTKSEDRRGIFEEAAGIVRYKSRKKEAEKRLDETESNLIRIFDVLHEIEGNLGPLAAQKEVAEKYKQLKQELSTEEIGLAVYTIEDLDQKCARVTQAIEQTKEKILTQTAAIASAEAEMLALKTKYDQKETELSGLSGAHLQVATEWEQTEGHKRVLLERIAATSHLVEESHNAEETIERERAQAQQELAIQKEHCLQLEQSIQEITGKMENEQVSSESTLQKVRLEQALEATKADLIQLLNQAAVARNELRNQETNLELLERRIARFSEEEGTGLAKAESLLAAVTAIEAEMAELTSQTNELTQQLSRLTQRENSLQAEREKLSGTARRLQTDLASRNSRLDLLRDMQQEYGGYNVGVRAVLQAADRGRLKGICGAVADLLQVPREYEVAIETALGGALQHVVVETENAGKEAILFLKSSGGGRSTFLPLDVIRPRMLGVEERRVLASQPGFLGVAAELVSADPKFRAVLENLLGGVIVANSIQDATKLARACQYRHRIVTLDGDVVNPGGSMTGGSQQKRSTSLLGRTREIADLEQECAVLHEDFSLVEQKIKELQTELTSLRQTAVETETTLGKMRALLSEKESMRREQSIEYKSISEKTAGAVLEKEQYDGERALLQEKILTTSEELQSTTEKAEASQAQVQQLENELRILQAEHEDLSEELTQFKVQLAAKDQELRSRRENIVRLENQLKSFAEQTLVKQQERTVLAERLTSIRKELLECEGMLTNLDGQKRELQLQIERVKEERAAAQKQLDQHENAVRLLRDELKKLEGELHQSEIGLTRMDVELSAQLDKLATEYQMSFEWAKSNYSRPQDPDSSRRKVQALRTEIDRLGEVNLGAIEEYERQMERFRFLDEQRNDLVEAKTKLYAVISDLDEEMSKRFTDTFTEIRTHFIEVFQSLFGGGRADLILVNPDQPLTTGIDVVAQPPGKKLQNLSLLSGGERALAAIALLFAILKVKPVPFCVLDEVEAALDEANVSRYAAYLRSFSQQTQFIAITHRRGTMEGADVLYGVTMEESGISKLVSVKLLDTPVASTAS